jgi:hypothetical protein
VRTAGVDDGASLGGACVRATCYEALVLATVVSERPQRRSDA